MVKKIDGMIPRDGEEKESKKKRSMQTLSWKSEDGATAAEALAVVGAHHSSSSKLQE